MIRFGLVGVNTSHADAFSRILNGTIDTLPLVPGAQIVALWHDEGQEDRARELAATHEIATVETDVAQLVGQVDAVLIVDDTGGGASHGRLATPFLQAGLPTFIDKPMTTDFDEAARLFDLAASTGAPLMSCSALRFAAELGEARERLAAIGDLSSVISTGPGDWYYYGVHAVELLGAVAGTGAKTVTRHAFPDRDVVVIDYGDGPTGIVQTLRDAAYTFELVAYGKEGHGSFEVRDSDAFYGNTMAEVVKMAQTGVAPLKPEQTLEVLAILQAGVTSAETGTTVPVATAAR